LFVARDDNPPVRQAHEGCWQTAMRPRMKQRDSDPTTNARSLIVLTLMKNAIRTDDGTLRDYPLLLFF